MSRTPLDSFEAKYRADADPWDFATSPYEQGRYDTTIAALGTDHFGRGLELGAAQGVLTERLCALCDELVALEPAPTAVARLRERVRDAHVAVVQGALPEDLPAGPFDLVVASEVLYYLPDAELDAAITGIETALRPGGLLLAVHWTGRSADHVQTGEAVHAALRARASLEHLGGAEHPGFLLDRFRRR